MNGAGQSGVAPRAIIKGLGDELDSRALFGARAW